MGRSVLVTGVAGFIGSNLAQRLLSEGFEVIGIDDFSSGYPRNLAKFKGLKNFKFIELNLMTFSSEHFHLFQNVEVVFHLAAGKIPRYTSALSTLRMNAISSDHIFSIAAHSGCKIIAASTSDVYGKNPITPFSESSDLVVGNPDVRRWSYAISKMFGEQLLYAYSEEFKNPSVSVRFFGAYGPGQNLNWKGGPIPVFIDQCLKGLPLQIHGDGSQIRSFTYVDDHIEALVRLMALPWSKPFHLNLGSDNEISILELAQRISSSIRPNEDLVLEYVPYSRFGKYEDVTRRIPDCKKAISLLHLPPPTPFDEGLRKTIEWQKKTIEFVD